MPVADVLIHLSLLDHLQTTSFQIRLPLIWSPMPGQLPLFSTAGSRWLDQPQIFASFPCPSCDTVLDGLIIIIHQLITSRSKVSHDYIIPPPLIRVGHSICKQVSTKQNSTTNRSDQGGVFSMGVWLRSVAYLDLHPWNWHRIEAMKWKLHAASNKSLYTQRNKKKLALSCIFLYHFIMSVYWNVHDPQKNQVWSNLAYIHLRWSPEKKVKWIL